MENISLLDSERFYLGSLCRRSHDYQNTDQSLRRKRNGDCVECHKLRSQSNRQSSNYCPDYFKYRNWLKNPRISLKVWELVEKEATRMRQQNRYQWDEDYREKKKSNYRKRYKIGPDLEKERISNWKENNPKLVIQQQLRRRKRVKEQSDGSITNEFIDKLKLQSKFCAYCKCALSTENKTIDHAIPIGIGGPHSINNIVICCEKCNYAKGDMPFEEWVLKPKIFNPFLDRI